MRDSGEKRMQRVVATVCATLFAVFTFLYVAVYQAPLLEAFYNEVATGKLNYNPWLVGGVVSLLLTLLALWLNSFAKLRREWTALAYLPSSLLLAFITDIDRGLYTGEAISCAWIYIFAVCFLLYGFVAFVLRRILFSQIKDVRTVTNKVLWHNMVLMLLLIALIGALSNNEENFKRETLMMSHYNRGDTIKALRVGKTSLNASRELTVMRAYVLAAGGELGEHLFEYPQYYGSEGLLPVMERTSPLVPDSVYSLLGAMPFEGEAATDFLSRIAHADSASNVVKEYYLSSLLLEKRLLEFKDEVMKLCAAENVGGLPKHYREALMLYADIAGEQENQSFEFDDAAMRDGLEQLRTLESKYDDPFIRGNYVRRSFGHTYWWYFLYSN